MVAPTPTLSFPSTSSPPKQALHLLPCSIAYDGPALISTYFLPRPLDKSTESAVQQYETSFRGRALHGFTVGLPEGYTGTLLTSSSNADSAPGASSATPAASTAIIPLLRSAPPLRGKAGKGKGAAGAGANKRKLRSAPVKMFSLDEDSDEEQERKKGKLEEGEGAVKVEVEVATMVETSSTTSLVEHPESSSMASLTTDSATSTLLTIPDTLPPTESDPQTNTGTAEGVMKAIGTFKSFTLWQADGPGDKGEDVFVRTVGEFIGLANLVHSY